MGFVVAVVSGLGTRQCCGEIAAEILVVLGKIAQGLVQHFADQAEVQRD